MDNDQIIELVLKNPDLSYEERKKKDLLNHSPVKKSELIRVVVNIVEKNGFFPYSKQVCENEGPFGEGTYIEKICENKYEYGGFIIHPSNNYRERKQKFFKDGREAASYYIEWLFKGAKHKYLAGIRIIDDE